MDTFTIFGIRAIIEAVNSEKPIDKVWLLKSNQSKLFDQLLFKLREKKIPFIIHTRDSDAETLDVITNYKNKNLKFLVHCFSSDYNFAKKILDLNGFLSFGGMLTFKNNDNISILMVNLKRMMEANFRFQLALRNENQQQCISKIRLRE